ncbi:serine/threonine-protein kinase [Kitasatospora phosalacinea]|uniref:non-specific serine/threonine protein kinase n=1 Tax=Kitasatospora phosalacinea TaxID=2065 RepID=A0ABW6GUU7_9ACTN
MVLLRTEHAEGDPDDGGIAHQTVRWPIPCHTVLTFHDPPSFPCGVVSLLPGTLLNGCAGTYRVVRALDKGGMGEIFVGRDLAGGREVAIKLQTARMFETTGEYGDYGGDLSQEFNRMRDILDVRGIPRVLDEGKVGRSGRRFLVMELVNGVTAAQWIEDNLPVPRAAAVSVIAQLCEILGRLHAKQYVHCDVTARNVMIQCDGSVRLLDVGISVPVGEAQPDPCGSPGYAPPEQHRGSELTPQVDVFSLGALLFQMLTGKLPYDGVEYPFDGTEQPFPGGLRAEIDKDLRALGLSMVSLDPLERPRAADELPEYLRRMLPAPGTCALPNATVPDPTAYYRHGLGEL